MNKCEWNGCDCGADCQVYLLRSYLDLCRDHANILVSGLDAMIVGVKTPQTP